MINSSFNLIVLMQEAGVIEAEFEEMGVKNVLKKFFTYREPAPLYLKKGKPFGDNPQVELPCWLSEEELDFYAIKFEQTGFTGPLNFYRAIHR